MWDATCLGTYCMYASSHVYALAREAGVVTEQAEHQKKAKSSHTSNRATISYYLQWRHLWCLPGSSGTHGWPQGTSLSDDWRTQKQEIPSTAAIHSHPERKCGSSTGDGWVKCEQDPFRE